MFTEVTILLAALVHLLTRIFPPRKCEHITVRDPKTGRVVVEIKRE